VTIPADLVKGADRLARRLGRSRSAVMSDAVRAHLAALPGPASRTARVAEAASPGYRSTGGGLPQVSDDALLAELRRRLGANAGPAAGDQTALLYDRAKLAELCRRRGIRRLSLFGSVLTGEMGPDSDVDVLVEFEPGRTPGLAIADVEDELSQLFGGRRVDLVTERSLHRLIRSHVLASAVTQYAS
jgi:hypothetical protein